ncbi:MAG: hypothetical protein ACI4MC_03830, partial [Candidatus Coproplasma sp.]
KKKSILAKLACFMAIVLVMSGVFLGIGLISGCTNTPPDNPIDTPDDPGDKPDDPGDKPDDPGDKPDDPGDKPDESESTASGLDGDNYEKDGNYWLVP